MAPCMFSLLIVLSLRICILTATPPDISDVISNEDVRNMTLEFMELCPRTPLCKVNIFEYLNITNFEFPCCGFCRCDEQCMERGDCCPDAHNSTAISYASLQKCVDFTYMGLIEVGNTYKVTAACPVTYGDKDVAEKCEQDYKVYDFEDGYTGFVPVTDTIAGETYKNIYCLECNNGSRSEALYWSVVIACLHNNEQLIWTPLAIHGYTDEACNVMFEPPEAMPGHLLIHPGFCRPVIEECNATGSQNIFDEKNERYCHAYDSKFGNYKNVHCALCNGLSRENITSVSDCGPDFIEHGFGFSSALDVAGIVASETLDRLETDMSTEEPLSVYENCTLASDISFLTNLDEISCIIKHCPKFEYLHGSECKPIYKRSVRYRVQLMIRFYPVGTVKLSHNFIQALPNVTQTVLTRLSETSSKRYLWYSLYDIYVKIDEAPIFDVDAMRKESNESPSVLYVELRIQIEGALVDNVTSFVNHCLELFETDFGQQDVFQKEYVSTTSGLLQYVFNAAHALHFQLTDDERERFGVENGIVSHDNKLILQLVKQTPSLFSDPFDVMFINKLVFCSQIIFDTSGFRRSMEKDGTIHVSVTGKEVPLSEVVFDEGYSYIAMCENDYETLINPELDIKATEPTTTEEKMDEISAGTRGELDRKTLFISYSVTAMAIAATPSLRSMFIPLL